MNLLFVTFVNILSIVRVYTQSGTEVGEVCLLKDGSRGVCTEIRKCPSAIELLKKKIRPQTCSFSVYDPIVCCKSLQTSSKIVTPGTKSKEYCKKVYWTNPDEVGIAAVGGEDADPKEFPHMAVLGYGTEDNIQWACGGTLISDQYVLTASHCLFNRELGDVKFVRLGDLNLKRTDDDAAPQDFTIIERIRHPEYKPPSVYNDIALIKLNSSAIFTDHVKPACLNTDPNIIENDFYVATGWGNTEFGGDTADHLQKVDITGYSLEVCRQKYPATPRRLSEGILGDMHICAGGDQKDTCQGDSGGPLQKRNFQFRKGYNIYGVTSFGKACGIGDSIGVYINVVKYLGWIEQIIWPN